MAKSSEPEAFSKSADENGGKSDESCKTADGDTGGKSEEGKSATEGKSS